MTWGGVAIHPAAKTAGPLAEILMATSPACDYLGAAVDLLEAPPDGLLFQWPVGSLGNRRCRAAFGSPRSSSSGNRRAGCSLARVHRLMGC